MSRQRKEKELYRLLEPLVEAKGYELVKLSYAARRHGLLALIIDSEEGIGVEDCEIVSRAVSDFLDEEDPIEHAYRLEVSSPGLERPLTKIEHFARFAGEKAKISTLEKIEGRQKFAGTLKAAAGDVITMQTEEGQEVKIPFSQVKKAHLWYTKF